MLGLESLEAQGARATAIEQRAAAAPPAEVLPEARAAYAAAFAELQRDEDALETLTRARGGVPSFDPSRAYGTLAGSQALLDAQQEVAGDRTALGRLADVLRTLNGAVDATSQTAFDTRSDRLAATDLDADQVVLLSSAIDDARALTLYEAYRRGQYMTTNAATALAVVNADQSGGEPVVVQARYMALLTRPGTNQVSAALLAATGDAEASYARFAVHRAAGLDVDIAAFLATSAAANVRAIYNDLLPMGIPKREAAVLSAAAGNAGKTPADAAAMYLAFRDGRPPSIAAQLAAVTFASGRPTDQVIAAQYRFIRAGYPRPDLATAAWSLEGRASITMAALATLAGLPPPS